MDRMTLRSPAELLSAVPYFFGFVPDRCLVVLAFHGKRIVFQARADLPPPDELGAAAENLAMVTARSGPSGVVFVGYGTVPAVLPMIEAVGLALARRKIPVFNVLRVDEGRYWEMLCDDPVCSPPEGVPFDPSATEFAALATVNGMVVHADREALAATLEPVRGMGIEPEIAAALDRLATVSGGRRGLRAAARTAVRQALERYMNGGRLDDDEVAWLAVLLSDVMIRDDTFGRITAGPRVAEHQEVWRDLVRRVPKRYVPAPATLLALVAWRVGNGTLADMAGERALAADGSYRLAQVLLQAVRQGMPPDALDDAPEPRRRRRRAPRLNEAA